jgi:hypothetical protein
VREFARYLVGDEEVTGPLQHTMHP